ncbi:MAG TPA: DUF6325 family protein [Microlunatus sp.]|nr:DUF6325 family protein [Microlunatus sp.]
MSGPVQVLVVGFDQPNPSGAVLAELGRLERAGIVRLVDVLLVERNPDGSLETLTHERLPDGAGAVAAALLGETSAGAGDDPGSRETGADGTWSLADAVPDSGPVAVALIEHLWAAPLRDAISATGGRPLDETWLGPDDLARLDTLLADRA